MKKNFLIIIFFMILQTGYSQERGIQFIENKPFQEILEMAESQNKLIFMDCYTTSCGSCKFLEKEIFVLTEVGDFYNKNFINIKIDIEKEAGKEIKEKYNVRGTPSLFYLNDKGDIVHFACGAPQKSEKFIALGKASFDVENNYQSLKNKINQGNYSAKMLFDFIKIDLDEKKHSTLLDNYLKNTSLLNLFSEDTWNLLKLTTYWNTDKYANLVVQNYDSFINKLGKAKVDSFMQKNSKLIYVNKNNQAIYLEGLVSFKDYEIIKLQAPAYLKDCIVKSVKVTQYRSNKEIKSQTYNSNILTLANDFEVQTEDAFFIDILRVENKKGEIITVIPYCSIFVQEELKK